MERVVTGNQTAFLRNRGMDENGLTTHLLIEHFTDNRTHPTPIAQFGATPQTASNLNAGTTMETMPGILFLDQEKAFDRVHWQFLFHCMEFYGIPQPFRNFYSYIFQNARVIYEVAGSLSPPIKLQQGTPQGDPSSPLLHLISEQPPQDRLLVANLFLTIYINGKRLDIESQGYADIRG